MTYSDCREGDGGLVRIGLSCDRQYLFASTREFVLAPGITPFDIYRIGLRRRCIEPVAVNLDELSNHGFRSQFPDRKSTRLNSSHVAISYAVFCLKKKKTTKTSMIANA